MDYKGLCKSLDEYTPSLVRFITKSHVLSAAAISRVTKIPRARLIVLRDGEREPTDNEIKLLAEFFVVSENLVRDAFQTIQEWRRIRQGAMIRPSPPRSPQEP